MCFICVFYMYVLYVCVFLEIYFNDIIITVYRGTDDNMKQSFFIDTNLKSFLNIQSSNIQTPITQSSNIQPSYNNFRYKKIMYCSNCNGKGHVFKECKKPIKSYGIIAFRKKGNELQVCLIRRRNTLNYEAFVRGKYKYDELSTHVTRMTTLEIEKIKHKSWDDLYNEICYHRTSKHAYKERKKAKQLYDLINVSDLFSTVTTSKWHEPEWEFPKGRKYYEETQEECALREFQEETNIPDLYVKLLNNTYIETFQGTNKKIYHNQYFLSLVNEKANEPYIDISSQNQITEVGDVDWFSYENAMALIRDYHDVKRSILKEAFEYINSFIF